MQSFQYSLAREPIRHYSIAGIAPDQTKYSGNMKRLFSLAIVVMLTAGLSQTENVRIGHVDFFGTLGIDVQQVRSKLNVLEGEVVSEDKISALRDRVNKAIELSIGHDPTDVSFVCCDDHQNVIVYVGLGGSNTAPIPMLNAPTGSTCLPMRALNLYDQTMDAVEQAVIKGNSGEDDSRGYSLSNDAGLRTKQLAMHEYALVHETALKRALQGCKKPEHRRAAAEILGYARRSEGQIAALARATEDVDADVRNNALRALWVLATASTEAAAEIPGQDFVQMLNSGNWHDRNKAGSLLASLTVSRPRQLLERLRTTALPSLIEMAQWENPGHAYSNRVLLGRIAGLDETQIQNLIATSRVNEIIIAARQQLGQ